MLLGEKILSLREKENLSQEKLAEHMNVSRQTVSKWETNSAKPQLTKIIRLADYFGVPVNTLLRDEAALLPTAKDSVRNSAQKAQPLQSLKTLQNSVYIREHIFCSEVNATLTASHAFALGRFLGWYFQSAESGIYYSPHPPKIVIGKDTRRSSYMLEYALVAGITASGGEANLMHVTTIPSVAYITRQDGFDCGVMITASYNPFYDNGFRLFGKNGEPLDEVVLARLEQYMIGFMNANRSGTDELPQPGREQVGQIVDYITGRNRYVGYLITLATFSYKKLKIGLDCGNGSAWTIARQVFEALGAKTVTMGIEPDGTNINRDCGSAHVEALCRMVREQGLDVGFAFDGDADSCIAVDEYGEVVNGEKILYILATGMKNAGILTHNAVVTTSLSNLGLQKALEKVGIETVITTLSESGMYTNMIDGGYSLGGDPTGYVVARKYASTGDGILTAILLTEQMCARKTLLSALTAPVMLYPTAVRLLTVQNREALLADARIKDKLEKLRIGLEGEGRILLEPDEKADSVRIQIESDSAQTSERLLQTVVRFLQKRDAFRP